ncbi:hypothetical protein FACS1894101_2500 [Betaproteobacteria bacterium]|nr:hypothetical protein FACS1894101_2500 [Betaproteobacteria bacterium]
MRAKTNNKRIINPMDEIFYARCAAKQLRKLPAAESKTIRREVGKLANMPDCAARIVSIEKVKKRDERTY